MTFQFKIQIREIAKPTVWRRVKVDADNSFRDLHKVIQLAFGWTFSHLYSFSNEAFSPLFQIEDPDFMDEDYGSPIDSTKIKLNDIFVVEKQIFTYVYDFGDAWEHKITLEKITDEKLDVPVCLAGKGKCPPEDCGGAWGYEDIKVAINEPSHPEYEDIRSWLGLDEDEVWEPNEFDLDEANLMLSEIKHF